MGDKIDFLNADTPIPGQNYCCLSFVSPEKCLKDKNLFFMTEFLKDYCKEHDVETKEVEQKYKDFLYSNQEKLQKDFDNQNNFQTSIRGLKVRGVYDSRQEAEQRAKILHRMDQDHHVFVGSIGQWLPWDPEADNVADQEYIEEGLNNLMGEYKKNQMYKDQFFEERRKEQMEDAMKKVEENKKVQEIEDTEESEPVKEQVVEEEQSDNSSSVQEISTGLEGDDPWLQRKKEEAAAKEAGKESSD